MADTTDKNLFSDFPEISTQAWEEKIQQDLKGADYENKLIWRTLEGFQAKPYYRAEHLDDKKYLETLPGEAPYLRGTRASENDWVIRQDILLEDIETANKKSLFVLDRGITSLGFQLPAADASNPLKSDEAFQQLLKDIYFECIHLNFVCGHRAPNIVEMLLKEVENKGIEHDRIFGSVDFDPLGYLTSTGNWNKGEQPDFEEGKSLLTLAAEKLPAYKVLAVNGHVFSNAGASVVQEMGYSLSMAADYLARYTEAGIDVDTLCKHMQFNLGVGTNYFMEIAKLRAFRYLYTKLIEAYQPKEESSKKAFIHSVTSEWSQTIYDPYVNVLRATTEGMSAVIGGTDSLTIRPFTYAYKNTSKFSGRVARNIQIILKEEAYLGKVRDAGAGSYYIENLTDSLIEEAWNILLKTEEEGGYLEALKKGIVQADVEATVQKRKSLIRGGRESLLGTNKYPNSEELISGEVDYNRAFPVTVTGKTNVNPIHKNRGAVEFEKLRLATEKHPGGRPKVFLLTYGNPVMRKARASFSSSFFACAGYEVIDNLGFDSPEAGAEAAKKAEANIVVLCSSDEEYTKLAPAVKKLIGDKTLLVVAGAPPSMDELKAAGIEYFIHMRSDILDTLTAYHQKLGIKL